MAKPSEETDSAGTDTSKSELKGDESPGADVNEFHSPRAVTAFVGLQYALLYGVQVGLFPLSLARIQTVFDLSNTAMGGLVGIHDLFQIGTAIFVPFTAKHFGMTSCIMCGAVLSAFGCTAFATSSHYLSLVLAQALIGIGSSFLFVLCPPLLGHLSQNKSETSSRIAFSYLLVALGIIGTLFIVGFAGVAGDGWRIMFGAAAPLFSFPLIYFVGVRVTIDMVVERSSSGWIPEEVVRDHTGDGPREPPLPLEQEPLWNRPGVALENIKQVMKNPLVCWLIFSQTSTAFFVSAFIAFVPKFVEVYLQQGTKTPFLLLAIAPVAAVGMIGGGILTQRGRFGLPQLLTLVLNCGLVGLLVNCFVFYIPSVVVMLVLLSLNLGATFTAFMPAIVAYSYEVPANLIPYVNGMSNLIGKVCGSALGPFLLGILLDLPGMGSSTAFFIVGVTGSIGAVMFATFAKIELARRNLNGSPTSVI